MKSLDLETKYDLYRRAVQSPEGDVEFLQGVYKELKKSKPQVLREDFCGTFALSAEWVKFKPHHIALGVDLDPEPIAYGVSHYYSKLKKDQQERLKIVHGNVLTKNHPELKSHKKPDIQIALNFSYFIFKTRDLMKQYFKTVYDNLDSNGIFVLDLFGGTQCQDAIEDTTKHKGFTYYWDQTGYDPVTNNALFHIHFKVGNKKHKNVFTYDWRLWSIPELKDILSEVGFKKSHIYWEGTNPKGGGNGIFTRTQEGEACLSWIAYIVAEK